MADEHVKITVSPNWQEKIQPGLQKALHNVADAVLQDAKDAVPVRTGRLRNSLIAEVHDGEARIGSRDVDYAVDVELGTEHEHAQPYLKPALYKKREGR